MPRSPDRAGAPDDVLPPSNIARRDELVAALGALRLSSSHSFKSIAERIGRPTTTVHGWFSGRHLPYQRDNEDFEHALRVIGVDDTSPWMHALARCRAEQTRERTANPYQGLAAYSESDGDRFFGRSAEIGSLIGLALYHPSTSPAVVIGASGSGKTSLLCAGLVPALREHGHVVRYATPTSDPSAAIAAVLDGPAGLLIIDQFEELLRSDPGVAEDSISALECWAALEGCDVVVGLRGDFFDRALDHPWLAEGLRTRQLLIEPPPVEVVPELVGRPAEWAGLTVEPRLIGALQEEFRNHMSGRRTGSALPLLSHVLYRMGDAVSHADKERRLTMRHYEAVGGIDAALEQSAEAAYGALDAEDRGHCERLFAQLIELGPDAKPTRREAHFSDVEPVIGGDGDLDDLLWEFTRHRILIADTDTVHIAHEALLTAWPRLARWIDDKSAELVDLRRVTAACKLWTDSDRDAHVLLAGPQLQRAQELLCDPAIAARVGDELADFVAASTRTDEIRRVRRRRRVRSLTALTATAVLLAVTTTVFAVEQRQASARAESARATAISRQLALQSSVLRPTDVTISKQLALAAFDVHDSTEARSALMDASAAMPSARYLGDAGATALAVSAHGDRIAYSNAVTGSVTVLDRDVSDFRRAFQLDVPDTEVDIYALALSPDGRHLVSGGTDFVVTWWDLDGDRRPVQLDNSATQFSGAIQSLAFDSSGSIVFGSGTSDHGIGVWDLDDDPASSSSLIPATGSTMAIDINDERELLASANLDGSVAVWAIPAPGEPLWAVNDAYRGQALSAAFNDDGTRLAIGYQDGTFRVWDIGDLADFDEIELDAPRFDSWVNAVRFSPDGRVLAAGSADSSVQFWNTEDNSFLGQVSLPSTVTNLRFADSHTALAAAADGAVRTIDLDDLSLASLGASIWSVNYSEDGTTLVATSRERAVVWNVNDGRPTHVRTVIPPPDADLGFSGTNALHPDGTLLALGSRVGPVFLADLNADRIDVLEGSLTALVENLAFSPNGKILAAGDDTGIVQLWTLSEQRSVTRRGQVQVEGWAMDVTFSTDGDVAMIAADTGEVTLVDVTNPDQPVELSILQSGDSIAFGVAHHPVEPLIAVANGDRTVTLWDVADIRHPRRVAVITGPNSRVISVAFTPDGQRLAAGVSDNSVWIWDLADIDAPNLWAKLSSAEGGIYTVAFDAITEHLAGAGADQIVYVWSLDTEVARERICSRTGDPITQLEWSNLVPDLPYRPPCDMVGP